MPLTYRCIIWEIHIEIKGDETNRRMQQYIQLNSGVKELQQLKHHEILQNRAIGI